MTPFARSLLLVVLGLAFLPLAATAAPEKPSKTTLISAYVGPSIVYVGITWKARVYEGLNARYAGDETGAEPGNAVVFEIISHCTGYVVNHDGYIATAGHCLDPKEQLDAFKVAAAEWAVERKLKHLIDNSESCRVAVQAGFQVEGLDGHKVKYEADAVELHAKLRTD